VTEETVMNLFTILRGLIVGGFLFILPKITRKGLLFGAYVGEGTTASEAAAKLRRSWSRSCIALTLIAIAVGLSVGVAGRPMTGTFVCIGVLVFVGPLVYLRSHLAARELAPPTAQRQGEVAVASLEADEPRGERLAKIALGTCIVVGVAVAEHAALNYDGIPAQVPTWFGFSGDPAALSPKSVGTVMVPSLMALVLAPFFALLALLTARAKRSLRGGSGGDSASAQTAFRATYANLLSGTALGTCAFLSLLSVQFVRLQLRQIHSWGLGLLVVSLAFVLFAIVGLVRLLVKFGQGGSLLEHGSEGAPLTDGIASDRHWFCGVIYVNRDDPSMMVEKRFGLGYTMNLGNRKALALAVVAPTLLFTLVALAILGASA